MGKFFERMILFACIKLSLDQGILAKSGCTETRRRQCLGVDGDDCADMQMEETRSCNPVGGSVAEPPSDILVVALRKSIVSFDLGDGSITEIYAKSSTPRLDTAAVDWNKNLVIFGFSTGIGRVSIDEPNPNDPTTYQEILPTGEEVYSLDIDTERMLIFYAFSNGVMKGVGYDGTPTDPEQIIHVDSCSDCIKGIAVDHKREKIYYTNAQTKTVDVCNYDGTGCTMFTPAEMDPRDIHLDHTGDALYWVGKEDGEKTGVVRKYDLITDTSSELGKYLGSTFVGVDQRGTDLYVKANDCQEKTSPDWGCPLYKLDNMGLGMIGVVHPTSLFYYEGRSVEK